MISSTTILSFELAISWRHKQDDCWGTCSYFYMCVWKREREMTIHLLADSHEHGLYSLSLHIHHSHLITRGRLWHYQEGQATPGWPGWVSTCTHTCMALHLLLPYAWWNFFSNDILKIEVYLPRAHSPHAVSASFIDLHRDPISIILSLQVRESEQNGSWGNLTGGGKVHQCFTPLLGTSKHCLHCTSSIWMM